MSCINLRLPPAKKAWQSFTSKLQNKLHKLNKSKNIKKIKYRYNPPITVAAVLVDHHHDRNNRRRRRLFNPFKSRSRSRNRFLLQKKTAPAPVYIDKLFREAVADDGMVVAKPPSATKTMTFVDKQAVKVAESAWKLQDEKLSSDGRDYQADDMWESLGFASPQMRGIDERAEQFIASFRAEMEVQELMDYDMHLENSSLLS